jgi:hypothetical protein
MIQTSLPVPSINLTSVNEVMIDLDTLYYIILNINIEISKSASLF